MLDRSQIDFFARNGYLLLPELLGAAEVAEAKRQMAQLLRDPDSARPRVSFSYEPAGPAVHLPGPEDNPRRVWMVMDTPLAGDWWYQNIRDARIVEALAGLLSPDINFHNGKARIKPPGYVSHQVWHQDWPYERHDVPDLAAAIIYLDDTYPGAAATEVIPGSHLQGEWPHDEQNAISEEEVRRFGAEPVALSAPAGSVAIIHVLVVHRATANSSEQNRSAIINEYKSAAALDRWGNPCAFADLPLARGGKVL